MTQTEIINIRGLLRLSAWILGTWGVVVLLKGLFDFSFGEPEANLYAPAPWAFVTRPQWLRYSFFECVYGVACGSLAFYLGAVSKFIPESIRRESRP